MFPCIDIRGDQGKPCLDSSALLSRWLDDLVDLLTLSKGSPLSYTEVFVCFRKVVVTLVVVALGLIVYFRKADKPVGAIGFFE